MKRRQYWQFKMVRQADLEKGDWIGFPDGMYLVTEVASDGRVIYREALNRKGTSNDAPCDLPADQPERLLPVRVPAP